MCMCIYVHVYLCAPVCMYMCRYYVCNMCMCKYVYTHIHSVHSELREHPPWPGQKPLLACVAMNDRTHTPKPTPCITYICIYTYTQRTFRAERAYAMTRAKASSSVVGWPGTTTHTHQHTHHAYIHTYIHTYTHIYTAYIQS
jgi:hypothetical protein